MKYAALVLIGLIMVCCSGCETLSAQQRRQGDTRIHNDIANLKASVQRLEQQLDGIEAGREDLHVQIADMRATQDRAIAQYGSDLQTVEGKLVAQSSVLERIRKELVEELSRRMADIIKSQPRPAAVRSESGYEHVVKAGQTLSEIAKAYGVKASVITEVNKLKNPDDLRIGQTLFIPE